VDVLRASRHDLAGQLKPVLESGLADQRRHGSEPVLIDAALSHGKPDPEVTFWRPQGGASIPAIAFVIEDPPAGVTATLAAGATVWAVNTATPMRGASRTYPTLKDAVSEVLEFAKSVGRKSGNQSPQLRRAVSGDDRPSGLTLTAGKRNPPLRTWMLGRKFTEPASSPEEVKDD